MADVADSSQLFPSRQSANIVRYENVASSLPFEGRFTILNIEHNPEHTDPSKLFHKLI
jgi:hypothetical protein